ncbi:hypothetical protein I4U23_017496 [Adineta vaga]|nr:hypothetical protein I4U23_017496 [Adineta vaga]
MASYISALSLVILVLISGCFTLPITDSEFSELTTSPFAIDLTTEKSFNLRTVVGDEIATTPFSDIKRSENEEIFLETTPDSTISTEVKRSLSEHDNIDVTTVGVEFESTSDVSRQERMDQGYPTEGSFTYMGTTEESIKQKRETEDSSIPTYEQTTEILDTITHGHEGDHEKRELKDEGSNDSEKQSQFTTGSIPLFTSTSSAVAPELYTLEPTDFTSIQTSTRKYVGSFEDVEEENEEHKTHDKHDKEESRKPSRKPEKEEERKDTEVEDEKHREEEHEPEHKFEDEVEPKHKHVPKPELKHKHKPALDEDHELEPKDKPELKHKHKPALDEDHELEPKDKPELKHKHKPALGEDHEFEPKDKPEHKHKHGPASEEEHEHELEPKDKHEDHRDSQEDKEHKDEKLVDSDEKKKHSTSDEKVSEESIDGKTYALGKLFDQEPRKRLPSYAANLVESDEAVTTESRKSSTTTEASNEIKKLTQGKESS